jgi:uncharacterized protein (TIGR02246 family)
MPLDTRPCVITVLALAAVVAGCARQADVATEERVIRDLDKKFVQAVAAKDTMTIGDLYAEDGEFLPQGAPRVTGRAAIQSAWAQFLQAPNLSLTFEPSKVVVSTAGDIAHETGTYRLAMDGPKGRRIEDAGKFVVTWKKVNGAWKVALDIFNSDKGAM